jgi:hypothetical protein
MYNCTLRVIKDEINHLEKNRKIYTDFLVKKVRSISGTIIPDADSSGSDPTRSGSDPDKTVPDLVSTTLQFYPDPCQQTRCMLTRYRYGLRRHLDDQKLFVTHLAYYIQGADDKLGQFLSQYI